MQAHIQIEKQVQYGIMCFLFFGYVSLSKGTILFDL